MKIKTITLDGVGEDSEMAVAWDEQVRRARNLYAMYQSRDWLSCTQDADSPPEIMLLDRGQNSLGSSSITLISFKTASLPFRISRWLKFSFAFDSVEVLGSQPLGHATFEYYRDLVNAIWQKYPRVQAIYFKSVPDDGALWRILRDQNWQLDGTHAYPPEGARPFHYLALPATFEAYMQDLKRKRRYNLKRQVRVLSEAFSGRVSLACITEPADIPMLIQRVTQVAQKSWKAIELDTVTPDMVSKPGMLAEIAANGLLRAYLLSVNDEPCAYVLGYQFNGIYHYSDIGYDDSLAKYSPGNVLLLLVIQDLIEVAGAKSMNFGVADAEYKRVFANRHLRDASLLLLRQGMMNSLKRQLHAGFQAMRTLARMIGKGRSAVPVREEVTEDPPTRRKRELSAGFLEPFSEALNFVLYDLVPLI
jgi:hypothetical protein